MAFLQSVAIAAVLGLCATALAQAAPITTFGTVSLSQNGANVNVDVDLASGVVFAETAGGGGALFLSTTAWAAPRLRTWSRRSTE